jgi:hypothetical protein
MTCEIIELSTFTRPSRSVSDKRPLGQRLREAKPELPPPATETAKNSRIRIKRRDAWWHADRMMDYWRARLDWQCALEIAQQYGIADSDSFPSAKNEDRFWLVDKWREAVGKKLLTPAPDPFCDYLEARETHRASHASQEGHIVKRRRRSIRIRWVRQNSLLTGSR